MKKGFGQCLIDRNRALIKVVLSEEIDDYVQHLLAVYTPYNIPFLGPSHSALLQCHTCFNKS